MWSSCPCVITTASILSRHCARKLVSGRIFCMPRSVKLAGRAGVAAGGGQGREGVRRGARGRGARAAAGVARGGRAGTAAAARARHTCARRQRSPAASRAAQHRAPRGCRRAHSGNMSPASTRMYRSYTPMSMQFMPISPRPPMGSTRSGGPCPGGGPGNGRLLRVVWLDPRCSYPSLLIRGRVLRRPAGAGGAHVWCWWAGCGGAARAAQLAGGSPWQRHSVATTTAAAWCSMH